MLGEFLHARLVAEDTALGAFAGGIDSEDGQTSAFLLQHVDAELVDTCALASSRHTTDAHTDRVTTIGQSTIDDLLRLGLMVRIDTLYECDSLRENGDIAFDDTLDHLADRELTTTEAVTLQVRVDDGLLIHATVHLQTCVF